MLLLILNQPTAGGGITGTSSIFVDSATGSGSGSIGIAGTSAAILGAAAGSASVALALVTGTSAVALGAAGGSAQASVSITGSAVAFLGDTQTFAAVNSSGPPITTTPPDRNLSVGIEPRAIEALAPARALLVTPFPRIL